VSLQSQSPKPGSIVKTGKARTAAIKKEGALQRAVEKFLADSKSTLSTKPEIVCKQLAHCQRHHLVKKKMLRTYRGGDIDTLAFRST